MDIQHVRDTYPGFLIAHSVLCVLVLSGLPHLFDPLLPCGERPTLPSWGHRGPVGSPTLLPLCV